jgi:hypothetical protein
MGRAWNINGTFAMPDRDRDGVEDTQCVPLAAARLIVIVLAHRHDLVADLHRAEGHGGEQDQENHRQRSLGRVRHQVPEVRHVEREQPRDKCNRDQKAVKGMAQHHLDEVGHRGTPLLLIEASTVPASRKGARQPVRPSAMRMHKNQAAPRASHVTKPP